MASNKLSLDKIYQASFALREVARKTDLIYSPHLSGKNEIYLKTENLQQTGSFKLRGAYYKISCLSDEEKAAFDYDMLVFFSPTGVKALFQNFPDFKQGDIKIAAFGPATAKEVVAQGLRLDLEAPSQKFPSMTMALKDFLKKNNK